MTTNDDREFTAGLRVNAAQKLIDKLNAKTAVIGIYGLGYVGLPLAIRYCEVGYRVIGFDIDARKVEKLTNSQSYIGHIPNDRIVDINGRGFEATTDFSRSGDVDALIVCVPTPLNRYREPDLSFVTNTVDAIVPHMRQGQVLSLESTTYPGTTDEELLPRLESGGLKVGTNVFLVYSPEREDPGNPRFNTQTIPKVCGGVTEDCARVGQALYQSIVDQVVPVSSTRTAELVKLLENIHRAVNIGLVNEMKIIADRMDIDIHEVITAAATKPFGFVPYYPGPGLGGHCIPIDPFYLTWKAREFGLHTRFIELAGEVNSSMPDYVVSKTVSALNDEGRAVKGARILVLGVAYKKNVDDMRESPAAVLIDKLRELGADVSYSDPHVPNFPSMRKHSINLASVELTERVLAEADCVLLVSDHDAFDYDFIGRHAKLIVDSRGRFRNTAARVVKA